MEWIKCSDSLPDSEYAKIIICWSNGLVDTWNSILLCELIKKPLEGMITVTHWMPFPTQPKEYQKC